MVRIPVLSVPRSRLHALRTRGSLETCGREEGGEEANDERRLFLVERKLVKRIEFRSLSPPLPILFSPSHSLEPGQWGRYLASNDSGSLSETLMRQSR